ncbi:MAG: hypothetical protein WBW80_05600 [Acidimicrobiales bacterium]
MTLVVESMNATAPVEYDTTGSEPTVAPEPPASEYELHYSDVPFRGQRTIYAAERAPRRRLPAWKEILLEEGYEDQASEALEIAELSLPSAVQAIDAMYD